MGEECGVRVSCIYGNVNVEEDVKRLAEIVVPKLGDAYPVSISSL